MHYQGRLLSSGGRPAFSLSSRAAGLRRAVQLAAPPRPARAASCSPSNLQSNSSRPKGRGVAGQSLHSGPAAPCGHTPAERRGASPGWPGLAPYAKTLLARMLAVPDARRAARLGSAPLLSQPVFRVTLFRGRGRGGAGLRGAGRGRRKYLLSRMGCDSGVDSGDATPALPLCFGNERRAVQPALPRQVHFVDEFFIRA